MPRRKKQRKDVVHMDVDVEEPRERRDLISTLPLELISDILLRTTPKDVLALARCNRYFCNLLTDPKTTYIWKATRQSFNPPVPDPTPNFTEPAYAAYVFDGGACEVSYYVDLQPLCLFELPNTRTVENP